MGRAVARPSLGIKLLLRIYVHELGVHYVHDDELGLLDLPARIAELQSRAIRAADRHFVVSRLWHHTLACDFGVEASASACSSAVTSPGASFAPSADRASAWIAARSSSDAGCPSPSMS